MKITSIKNRKGIVDHYFTDYEGWECFDDIIKVLGNLPGVELLEQLDGIAIRKRKYLIDSLEFYLMHDDHVGNYMYTEDQEKNSRLFKLAHTTLEKLNKIL